MHRKKTTGEWCWYILCRSVLLLFCFCCLLPFWLVIVNSFVPAKTLLKEGFQIFPRAWTLEAYAYVLGNGTVFRNYGVSVFVTCAGTVLATLVTSMYAYGLAHPRMKYRDKLSFLTYIPMVLGSGMVGFFLMMVKYLHLYNNIWALILPYVISPMNCFILVAYYRDLPYELLEAGYIDGANDWKLFWQVVRPLSKIPIVTILLFYALTYWNDWWLATLFITDAALQPLQILIRKIISRQLMANFMGQARIGSMQPLTTQLVTVCITIGPILLLYPFIQRYFISGITVGAVKG